METVIELIKNVGFPIACVVFLGFYVKQQSDTYRADIKEITEKYDGSVKQMSEENNTTLKEFRKTLEKYTTLLSAYLNKGENEK